MNNHKKILEKAKKIAVIRTDRLGDMVLTLPLCKAIKENFPDKELSLIAQKYTEPLLINSPVLDKYFFLNDYENGIHDIFKEQKFHVAFFPRPKFNEAYTAFKNRIPLRIGSGYRIYSFLFNHRVYDHRKTATRHEAEFNVRLLTSITNEQYKTELIRPYINPKTFSKLSNILEAKGFNFKEQYFIIHPGSGGSANEWEPKKFGKAASAISQKTAYKILITGVKSEENKCKIAQSECPSAINLCSELSLTELIALISKSKLLIANSTGVLHIAAALDVPVIGLYPNSPNLNQNRWGPYSKKAVIINPPQSNQSSIRDNMSLINVEDLLKKTSQLF